MRFERAAQHEAVFPAHRKAWSMTARPGGAALSAHTRKARLITSAKRSSVAHTAKRI